MLKKLRVESIRQIGQLNSEEWHEMMAAMCSASVALGSRNKLRLLVTTLFTDGTWSSGGPRRAQDVSVDEASNTRSGRQTDHSATTEAMERASEQECSNEKPTSTDLVVSTDSAPSVKIRV